MVLYTYGQKRDEDVKPINYPSGIINKGTGPSLAIIHFETSAGWESDS